MASHGRRNDGEDDVLEKQEEFIQRMKDEGTLDENFDTVAELRSLENPRFLADIIETYVTDSAMVVARIESQINQDSPFYDNVYKDLCQLMGSSSSMGGGKVAAACLELRHSINEYDRQRCLESLRKVKEEHRTLRDGLNQISLMEMTILDQNVSLQENNQSENLDDPQ